MDAARPDAVSRRDLGLFWILRPPDVVAAGKYPVESLGREHG